MCWQQLPVLRTTSPGTTTTLLSTARVRVVGGGVDGHGGHDDLDAPATSDGDVETTIVSGS